MLFVGVCLCASLSLSARARVCVCVMSVMRCVPARTQYLTPTRPPSPPLESSADAFGSAIVACDLDGDGVSEILAGADQHLSGIVRIVVLRPFASCRRLSCLIPARRVSVGMFLAFCPSTHPPSLCS